MEIYNEVVRDLLTPDDTPLRLLNDPEVTALFHLQRGTVVENFKKVTLKDWNRLKEPLSVCEGETALNEVSSRSHQILLESTTKKIVVLQNASTLTAANFVDLARIDYACQTLSTNVRMKEGRHINRSYFLSLVLWSFAIYLRNSFGGDVYINMNLQLHGSKSD
ncbi:hypothetical protein P3L10_032511 [Capsicum annuum]